MKTFTLKSNIVGAFAIILLASSCTDNTPTKEKVYASSIAGNSKTKKLNENDLRFLVMAHSTGLFRIALANEAAVRSTSLEAIQFAAAVRNFYTKLNYEIEDIAVTHDFVLPMDISDDEKLVWKELVKEKGWKFDKKFREVFEKYRNDDVFLFENAALNVVDKNVNLIAVKAQPELKLHDKLRNVLCEKVEEKTITIPVKDVITKTPKRAKDAIAKS